jgi:hypothetical protein
MSKPTKKDAKKIINKKQTHDFGDAESLDSSIGSQNDDDSENNSSVGAEKLKRTKQSTREELRIKYIQESCTTLNFVYASGSRRECLIEHQMESYSDLQRAVAKLHPRSKQLFMIQSEDGAQIR